MAQISIIKIIEVAPPFSSEQIESKDTQVSGELILETPSILVTGTYYNPETQQIEQYLKRALQNNVIKANSTIISPTSRTFIGPITIAFSSRYPLKTYKKISRKKNQIIGDPPFGYQANKAEIRYNFSGGIVTNRSAIYKRPFILKHNTAGSDNIVLNYKLFYKGKQSHLGTVNISISKIDDKFYSFNENG